MTLDDLQNKLAKRFEVAQRSGRHPDDFLKSGLDLIQDEALGDEEAETAKRFLEALCAQLPVPLLTDRVFAAATAICLATGRALEQDAAVQTIVRTWPAPVAHELLALVESLEGIFDGEQRRAPSPESALLQLRDFTETLLRVPGIALATALMAQPGVDADWVRIGLARVSGGAWKEFAKGCAERLLARGPAHPLAALARLFSQRSKFLTALETLIAARNDYLGHSGVRPDPEETAGIVRWFVVGGDEQPKNDPNIGRPGATLLVGLQAAAAAAPWQGVAFELFYDKSAHDLMGADALRGWFSADARHRHDSRTLPVSLRFDAGGDFTLSPWISARQCTRCGKRDVFMFDVLYDRDKFDLQDYGRGHKMRLKRTAAADLDAALPGSIFDQPPQDAVFAERDDDTDNAYTCALLDRQRVDLRYLSPQYLRHHLAEFIESSRSGVCWLEAPAHVGKTTFVQGLALSELREGELAKGLRPGEGGGVLAVLCKKEYREGGGSGFVSGVHFALPAALGIRLELFGPDELPDLEAVQRAADRRLAFANLIAKWRRISTKPNQAILLVVDGLDEADPPGPSGSLFDYLPRPADLATGIYVLLTSRRIGDPDCPEWLQAALAPLLEGEPSLLCHRRLDVEDSEYVALMRDYAARQLARKVNDAEFQDRFARILEAAAGLFVYVSLLIEQIRAGRLKLEDLPEGRLGDQLYDLFLDRLGTSYQAKLADDLREVLAALAAAEAAHDWLFNEGAVPDLAQAPEAERSRWIDAFIAAEPLPRLRGVPNLEPVDRAWTGIELDLLAEAVDMDAPPGREGRRRYRGRFIILLFLLQGTLGVWRGDRGAPRYRIGLKGLAERLALRDEFQPLLQRMHLSLAGLMLDAVELVKADDVSGNEDDRWRAWRRVDTTAALLPGHVRLAASDPLKARFSAVDLPAWDSAIAGALAKQLDLIGAMRWQRNAAVALTTSPASGGQAVQRANHLARAFIGHGNAKQGAGGHGPGAAIADYDAAIAIREGLRAALEPGGQWEFGLRNDLANAYMNRGNAKRVASSHGSGAAIADHDAAIAIREGLRAALEPTGRWEFGLRNDLAAAYMNRGVAKQDASDHSPGAAIADYDAAIAIREGLRAALEPTGRWEFGLRNALAGAYMNRGVAKQGAGGHGPGAAIADHDAAIAIREGLRTALEPGGQWEFGLRNDLANAYMNRGNAKRVASSHGPGAAIADYDLAIAIGEDVRAALEPGGQWEFGLRNDLAAAYMNRGNAKLGARSHGSGAAIADYDAAIAIGEDVRAALEPAGQWEFGLRNDLANAYVNRGVAKEGASSDGPGAAIADYDLAIAIMEGLRAALEPTGRWKFGLRNDLAAAYMNRGNAKLGASSHGPGAAIADYDAAIAIGEDVRTALEPVGQWEFGLRNALAGAYMNRGVAKQGASSHGPGAAIADYDAAIAIGESLRTALEPDGRWEFGLRNGLTLAYRNRAIALKRLSRETDAAADRARADDIERS